MTTRGSTGQRRPGAAGPTESMGMYRELVDQLAAYVVRYGAMPATVREVENLLPMLAATAAAVISSWEQAQRRGWTAQLARHAAGRTLTGPQQEWLLRGRPADVRAGIELVAWLLTLPALPVARVAGPPVAESKVLTRVRALLAKAESTEFPEEADALTAKAQHLVAEHSLEQALSVGATGDLPTSQHIPLDDPYADAKSMLVNVVAKANRCSAVYLPSVRVCTVMGFAGDLDAVDILFTSLLVQATRALTRAGKDPGQRQPSYRRSFLISFASRISERLEEAQSSAQEAVSDDRLLPVLATRALAVDEAVGEAFPRLKKRTVTVSNGHGWAAGRAAADLAKLDPRGQVE